MNTARIACVSDVCLGYGSPQIGYLIRSLAEHYETRENLVIEPHRPESPPLHSRFPELRSERVHTAFTPYSDSGRIEYIMAASRMLETYSPDVLVICCTFSLPVLFKLRKRPRVVIYYSNESIPFYGAFDVEMNRHLDGLVDIVIFPEENRAAKEIERFGFRDIPKLVLYNCPDVHLSEEAGSDPRPRNGRVIYAGAIDRELTFADYYRRPEVQEFPIDLYGPIHARDDRERREFLDALGGNIRYLGHRDNKELETIRKRYSYSIVMWNPSVENQLFAAPNKFFESIAAGVPAIAAPHPQCRMLIERYKCGLVMPDWSCAGFRETLAKAQRSNGGDRWLEMVANCTSAVSRELNWNHQFEKLKAHLKD